MTFVLFQPVQIAARFLIRILLRRRQRFDLLEEREMGGDLLRKQLEIFELVRIETGELIAVGFVPENEEVTGFPLGKGYFD